MGEVLFNIFYLQASFRQNYPLEKGGEERLDSVRCAASDGISRDDDFGTS